MHNRRHVAPLPMPDSDPRRFPAFPARLRRAFVAATAWLALAGLAGPACAQPPLVLLVPYPVGALSDSVARVVAPALALVLDRPVVVENLGGAGGALAARRVLKTPADGELLLQGSPNELILAPMAQPSAGFIAGDFRMVQIIGSAPLVVVARADLPAASFGELIELARRSAANAQPLSYGSVGVGSLYHLLGRQLAQRLDVPMTHVPYTGGAPLMRDLAGGVVDFAIMPGAASTFALVDEGRLKLLGTLEPPQQQPRPRLRSLPSLAGDSRMSGFSYSIWSGYFVRADTPPTLVQHLNEALAIALRDPQVRARLEAQGADPMPAMDPAAAQAFYQGEIGRYDALAPSGGAEGAPR
ncbi:MAG: ABC transporter substrate-binding protein [Burkholderiales bacterium]|nr:MAG: ABC transporter substrate-binding protein [Burkholderiales bacterium]